MQVFINDQHHLHVGRQEMFRGRLVDCHEVPSRFHFVLDSLRSRSFCEFAKAETLPNLDETRGQVARVHSAQYLAFLEHAWSDWVHLQAGNEDLDALPSVWPLPNRFGFSTEIPPANFAARLGMYSFDSGTPLTSGSWSAAMGGAQATIAAARAVSNGSRSSFVLTRPPGHHAGPDYMGGYCFVNNAAVAATILRDRFARVAILDIDFHHGNGTQTCFYDRSDVFTISIHADPVHSYPFYLGHANERGHANGLGFNLNLPLPIGSDYQGWSQALETACTAVTEFGAQALVVPLGVDTFEGDPISGFRLKTSDYKTIGARLAQLHCPTVFTFEGGYAVQAVGENVANVLESFHHATIHAG